ncbi:Uncharacterised protein [Burkholderia pseudomallei]|nr:Uncharacterised protein [Burkholderia pseudomallei]CAJ4233680.1 Uncharacterised protein [Burkholderia pseudomallei]CAK0568936.1 Uncharacterised protein [Burkholderia pseudomallei]
MQDAIDVEKKYLTVVHGLPRNTFGLLYQSIRAREPEV